MQRSEMKERDVPEEDSSSSLTMMLSALQNGSVISSEDSTEDTPESQARQWLEDITGETVMYSSSVGSTIYLWTDGRCYQVTLPDGGLGPQEPQKNLVATKEKLSFWKRVICRLEGMFLSRLVVLMNRIRG